jgi:hypothetical protein
VYKSLVPSKDTLISSNFEKRVYSGDKKVEYFVNGKQLPWFLGFLAEADIRILLIRECVILDQYCTSKGEVITMNEKFQDDLKLYAELLVTLFQDHQGRPERDHRMVTAAPYAYRRYYLKPLNGLQCRTRAFLTK